MATKNQQALINNFYTRLYDRAERLGKEFILERILRMELEAETHHRKGAPDGWRAKNMTVRDSARYFVVRDVFKGLYYTAEWTTQSLLTFKPSVILAFAFAREYKQEITEIFTNEEINQLLALDYGKMME